MPCRLDFHLIIKRMILRYIAQILLNIPVEQQVHIVNWRIINQPSQFTALIHIPGNLGFHQSAVNGDHAAVYKSDFDTGSVDIERTGNYLLIRNSVLLICFFFLGPLGFDSGRLMTPFRK